MHARRRIQVLVTVAVIAALSCIRATTAWPAFVSKDMAQSPRFTVVVRPVLRLDLTETPQAGKAPVHPAPLYLPDEVEDVTDLRILDDKLVVLGKLMKSAGDAILLIALDTGKIVNNTWCYYPVISPSQQRVAFVTFFPRFQPVEQIWPRVAVLEVGSSAPRIQELYPPEQEPRGPKKYWPLSPMLWSDDGNRFVLFIKYGPFDGWDEYEVRWLLIDLSNGLEKAETHVRSIDVMDYVRPGTPKKDVHFAVTTLRWKDSNSVEATLAEQSYWRSGTIVVGVEEGRGSGR